MKQNFGYYAAIVTAAVVGIIMLLGILYLTAIGVEVPERIFTIAATALSFVLGVHLINPPRNGVPPPS